MLTISLPTTACFNCGDVCVYNESGMCELCSDYWDNVDASAPKEPLEVPDHHIPLTRLSYEEQRLGITLE